MKEKKAQANGEEKVKRPPSASNNFMKTQLAKLKTEDPSLSHSEAFKAVGPMWKLLSNEEQQAFKLAKP